MSLHRDDLCPNQVQYQVLAGFLGWRSANDLPATRIHQTTCVCRWHLLTASGTPTQLREAAHTRKTQLLWKHDLCMYDLCPTVCHRSTKSVVCTPKCSSVVRVRCQLPSVTDTRAWIVKADEGWWALKLPSKLDIAPRVWLQGTAWAC